MKHRGSRDELGEEAMDIATLVHDHHQCLYAYAFRLTGKQHDAEDLVQQTFLTAQQKIHQVRESATVRSWLYAVLRNSFLKNYRRRDSQLALIGEMSLDEIPGEVNDELWFDSEKLQHAIDGLPTDFKVVLMMYYFEDLSYREISETLKLPMGTVMSRLSRAKSQLRGRLSADSAFEALAGRGEIE